MSRGKKASWGDELLAIIYRNPDWSNIQLSKALDGQATPEQVASWKYSHRKEICGMFGTKGDEKTFSTEEIDTCNAAVKNLTSQTDEEAKAYSEAAKRESAVHYAELHAEKKGVKPDELKVLTAALEKATTELEKRGQVVIGLKNALTEERARNEKLNAEVNRARLDAERIDAVKSERDGLRKRVGEIEGTLAEKCRGLAEAEKARDEFGAYIQQLMGEHNEQLDRIQELTEELERVKAQRADLDAELTAAGEIIARKDDEIRELQKRGEGRVTEADELKLLIAERTIAGWRNERMQALAWNTEG